MASKPKSSSSQESAPPRRKERVAEPEVFEVNLKGDDVYANAVKRLKVLKADHDFPRMAKEITGLHATRHIRHMDYESLLSNQQKGLIEANLQNAAFRSQAIAIKMTVLKITTVAGGILSDLRNYLAHRHSGALRQQATTVAERAAIINSWIGKYASLPSEANYISELADLLINDLDQAGWTLRRINDVIALRQSDRA
jgi:hypothetical protein